MGNEGSSAAAPLCKKHKNQKDCVPDFEINNDFSKESRASLASKMMWMPDPFNVDGNECRAFYQKVGTQFLKYYVDLYNREKKSVPHEWQVLVSMFFDLLNDPTSKCSDCDKRQLWSFMNLSRVRYSHLHPLFPEFFKENEVPIWANEIRRTLHWNDAGILSDHVEQGRMVINTRRKDEKLMDHFNRLYSNPGVNTFANFMNRILPGMKLTDAFMEEVADDKQDRELFAKKEPNVERGMCLWFMSSFKSESDRSNFYQMLTSNDYMNPFVKKMVPHYDMFNMLKPPSTLKPPPAKNPR